MFRGLTLYLPKSSVFRTDHRAKGTSLMTKALYGGGNAAVLTPMDEGNSLGIGERLDLAEAAERRSGQPALPQKYIT